MITVKKPPIPLAGKEFLDRSNIDELFCFDWLVRQ